MGLKFKRRKGEVKVGGDEEAFAELIADLALTDEGDGPVMTFADGGGDKLVIWGMGREIASLLNKYRFIVRAERAGAILEMLVTWKPATRTGAISTSKAAVKGAVKKGAKLGARAAAAAATEGTSEAYEAADAAKDAAKVAKSVFDAARGKANLARNNLNTEWELRVRVVEGPGAPEDGPNGPVHRSAQVGQETMSGILHEMFLELVGRYTLSTGNMQAAATRKARYDMLLDQDDVIHETAEAEEKAKKSKSGRLKGAVAWAKARWKEGKRKQGANWQQLDEDP